MQLSFQFHVKSKRREDSFEYFTLFCVIQCFPYCFLQACLSTPEIPLRWVLTRWEMAALMLQQVEFHVPIGKKSDKKNTCPKRGDSRFPGSQMRDANKGPWQDPGSRFLGRQCLDGTLFLLDPKNMVTLLLVLTASSFTAICNPNHLRKTFPYYPIFKYFYFKNT